MMLIVLTLLGVVLWWVLGITGFIWRWTKTWDLTDYYTDLLLMSGMLGPLAWVFGYPRRRALVDMDKTNIEFVRKQTESYAKLNTEAIQSGIKPIVRWVDYDYMSNPHKGRIFIRTRNKVTRQLQEGKVL